MTPSTWAPPRSRAPRRSASVRSRWTACRGSSSASGEIRDHASACRRPATLPVRRVGYMRNRVRRQRRRRTGDPTAGSGPGPGWVNPASARLTRPATSPQAGGDRGRTGSRDRRAACRPAGYRSSRDVRGAVHQTRYGRALLTGQVRAAVPRPATRVSRRGDQIGRRVLGCQLGGVERRVRDLQHPGDRAVRSDTSEVPVLLAAERFRRGPRSP